MSLANETAVGALKRWKNHDLTEYKIPEEQVPPSQRAKVVRDFEIMAVRRIISSIVKTFEKMDADVEKVVDQEKEKTVRAMFAIVYKKLHHADFVAFNSDNETKATHLKIANGVANVFKNAGPFYLSSCEDKLKLLDSAFPGQINRNNFFLALSYSYLNNHIKVLKQRGVSIETDPADWDWTKEKMGAIRPF